MRIFITFYCLNKTGATAIEYALLAAGIAIAIVASLFAFGLDLSDIFVNMESTSTQTSAKIETYNLPE